MNQRRWLLLGAYHYTDINMVNRQIWPDDILPVEELNFTPLEHSYVKLLMARIAIIYIILMACAVLIPVFVDAYGLWILLAAECTLAGAMTLNLILSRKIYNMRGYALRDHDISYRTGLFFTKVTTIPFDKIQQVTIRMNPLSRIFGLYYLDVINGSQAAMNQITIPGLSHDRAERIKSLLISKAEECPEDAENTEVTDTPDTHDATDDHV